MYDDESLDGYGQHILAELKRHDRWLSSLDKQINNHITEIEHRVTEIEVNGKNMNLIIDANNKSMNKFIYLLISLSIGIFGMLFTTLVL